MSLCIEVGKPIKDSRGEVSRLIDTFRIAAEESVRIGGEVMNLEVSPRARGYHGMFKRVPTSCFPFPQSSLWHALPPSEDSRFSDFPSPLRQDLG